MINAADYRRRMASLARAEAVRGPSGRPIPAFSAIALARRCGEPEAPGGVDPVAVSRPDATPLMLRH